MPQQVPEHPRDAVIDAYRAGVDVTLIDANLRLTIEERLRKLMEWQRVADELRRAAERARR